MSGRLAASVSPNSSSSSAALRRALCAPEAEQPREDEEILASRSAISSTEAYWPVTPISWRTICGSLHHVVAEDSAPLPPSGRSSVASMRMVVVLPAPFGPSTP